MEREKDTHDLVLKWVLLHTSPDAIKNKVVYYEWNDPDEEDIALIKSLYRMDDIEIKKSTPEEKAKWEEEVKKRFHVGEWH